MNSLKQIDGFFFIYLFRLYQVHVDQVYNVLIVKHKIQHYGDEIVKVNPFVMHVVYIINFIK